jgi:hypothetical protein
MNIQARAGVVGLAKEDTRAVMPQLRRLMDKDLDAAQELAAQSNISVPLVDAARANGAETLAIPPNSPS